MRCVTAAAAQMGPNHESTSREEIIAGMLARLEHAASAGGRAAAVRLAADAVTAKEAAR